MKNNLKDLRKQAKLTQQELANICMVSRNTICSLERGEYFPGVYLYLKLEWIFGEAVYWLSEYERKDLDMRTRFVVTARSKAVGKSSKAPQGKVPPEGNAPPGVA